VASIFAASIILKALLSDVGESEGAVEFAIRQESGVRGDGCAVKCETQRRVELHSDRRFSAFTHWILRFRALSGHLIPSKTKNYSTSHGS